MSNPNPRQNPRANAPRRGFRTLLPYILLFAVIGVVIWLAFFSNPISTKTLTENGIIGYLTDNAGNLKGLTVVTTETTTKISGVLENGNKFVVVVSNTFYENIIIPFLYGADGSITPTFDVKVINAFERTFWNTIGPNLIYLVLFVVVMIFLYTRMAGAVNQSNSKAMEFNRSRARLETKIKKTFADVAGADAEKQEMMEIVDYLKNPKKYSQFGAKLPKGILLVGPPGTGKTLLAKAVAGEANVPFYSISGSDFVEMFVGVGAGRVRDMFQQAKKTAPCLIFIDELDAVGRQRGAGLGGGNDEREQTLNQLLIEMDGFADNSGIMVMAATNRDDVLDPALLRAGRFDRKITVSLPDRAGRAAIFKVHARGKVIDSSVDFDAISRRTVGFSGADIESILNDAAILAVRDKADKVMLRHIDEAIDRRIAGPARSSKGLNEHERKVIAYHEAGHAIIGLNQPFSDKVQKITIIPRGRTGGHVLMTPEEDRFLVTKNE